MRSPLGIPAGTVTWRSNIPSQRPRGQANAGAAELPVAGQGPNLPLVGQGLALCLGCASAQPELGKRFHEYKPRLRPFTLVLNANVNYGVCQVRSCRGMQVNCKQRLFFLRLVTFFFF